MTMLEDIYKHSYDLCGYNANMAIDIIYNCKPLDILYLYPEVNLTKVSIPVMLAFLTHTHEYFINDYRYRTFLASVENEIIKREGTIRIKRLLTGLK